MSNIVASGKRTKARRRSVKVNVETLIRELSYDAQGTYSQSLGKLKAKGLINKLNNASSKCAKVKSKHKIVENKKTGEKIVIMLDRGIRREISNQYPESNEVKKLTKVDSMKLQKAIISILEDKIENADLHPTKQDKRRNQRIKEQSKQEEVAEKKSADVVAGLLSNHIDIIDATVEQAADFIANDLDVAGSQRMHLKNGDTLYSPPCGSALIRVSKEVYIKAYARVNRISLLPQDTCD